MNNLTWQKNSSGNYVASFGDISFYHTEKRTDSYVNLYVRIDSGADFQLNDKRLTLKAAKELAQKHYDDLKATAEAKETAAAMFGGKPEDLKTAGEV